jgi:PIN domain nuclease of toxin-antitoxin system
MKLLIDTHTALWLFNEYENLSPIAKDYLHNEDNELYISIVSAWEIAIKHSLGKLTDFPGGIKLFLTAISESPIEIVTVLPEHVVRVESLTYIHRDPFDRLIIATALCNDMAIVTADDNIRKYDVKCIW